MNSRSGNSPIRYVLWSDRAMALFSCHFSQAIVSSVLGGIGGIPTSELFLNKLFFLASPYRRIRFKVMWRACYG